MVKLFVKSDIRKVSIALEKVFYHEVYLELGKTGFIHLSRSQDSASDIMMEGGLKDEEAKSREILSGIEYVMNTLNIQPGEDSIHDKIRDTSQDEAFVSRIKSTIERTQRLRSRIQESLGFIAERISYLEALNRMGIDPGAIKTARLVKMVFGTVENTDWGVPVKENFVLAKAGRYVFGTALPKDISTMLQFLKAYGYTDKSDDIREASIEHLTHREDILRHRLEILDGYLNNLRDEKGHALMKLYGVYMGYEEVLKALRMSLFSSRSMFITGWMDITEKQRLFSILQGICSDKFIAIVSEQRDADAPVRLRNIRLFRPFELLVKTMGIPSNSEIDPTPLTAITFVLMFGLMFGDLGQGLVLALGGIILKRIAKKKGKPLESLGQAGGILILCGFSAAICGLLYGSIFSSEHIIPALWFHPMEHVMNLFYVTILMGAIFIMAGLCVNIINSLMNSDYTGALLGKRSLAVLILYAAIVLIAVRYTRTGQGPAPWEVGGFIVLPLFLFSLRGVLGPALFKEHKPHSISEYVIETLMEILEIGLSMLANTISFIRVGAFALSHAGLSIVTYTLAGIADPAMKSVGAIAIIIIGNIFIIGFEGLICGIQSMRLEYYEFFSKFFKGDGVAFTPFILKAKTSEV
ncbi:MAG: V-type ATPase 116kDa subunit family protein [Syntrophales bacterium]|nr:V-type ATPase 116kDa subunit family protein [Syntrophales bacterium]